MVQFSHGIFFHLKICRIFKMIIVNKKFQFKGVSKSHAGKSPADDRRRLNSRFLSEILLACIFLIFSLSVSSIYAAETMAVRGVTCKTDSGRATISIELSSLGRVVHFRQDHPERIILDLKNAVVSENVDKQIDIADTQGPVKSIRTSQRLPDTVRIVVNLAGADSEYSTTLWKRPLRYMVMVQKREAMGLSEAEIPGDLISAETAPGNRQTDISRTAEYKPGAILAGVPKNTAKEAGGAKQEKTSGVKMVSAGDSAAETPSAESGNAEFEKIQIRETDYFPMDFAQYVKKVMEANPSVKISAHDYRETQLKFLRDLQAYGFQLGLNGYASASIEKSGTGATIRLDLSKNLYDGGKKQILENQFEIVKALSRANLLEQYDTIILTCALYYSEFYYKQEVLDFLMEQFRQRKGFIERMEKSYQEGLKFSSYDFLTSRSDYLALEKALVEQKADFTKTEIAFRQFGHLYSEGGIRLAPLDVMITADMQKLQKFAIVHNKSIHSARLKGDLQEHKIEERKAEGGLKIDATSSVGLEGGSTDYTGSKNVLAGVTLNFSLPLYDSGVRKTEILTEQIGYLKQRLILQKTEEDVIRKLNDIYTDYRTFGSSLDILQEQLLLNEKRLRISMERLEKGLDDYRAVRESWDELINTRMEFIRQKTLEQKLLVDLLILSGMNLFH